MDVDARHLDQRRAERLEERDHRRRQRDRRRCEPERVREPEHRRRFGSARPYERLPGRVRAERGRDDQHHHERRDEPAARIGLYNAPARRMERERLHQERAGTTEAPVRGEHHGLQHRRSDRDSKGDELTQPAPVLLLSQEYTNDKRPVATVLANLPTEAERAGRLLRDPPDQRQPARHPRSAHGHAVSGEHHSAGPHQLDRAGRSSG